MRAVKQYGTRVLFASSIFSEINVQYVYKQAHTSSAITGHTTNNRQASK